MTLEKQLQIAVAKADLIISTIVKNLIVVLILTLVLLFCVYEFKAYMEKYHDPYWIDYDHDYFDMTSEGDD